MQIRVNGELRELRRPTTVGALLAELEVDGRRVAVEVNRRILKRVEFDQVQLAEGDVLEVVHFVGGG